MIKIIYKSDILKITKYMETKNKNIIKKLIIFSCCVIFLKQIIKLIQKMINELIYSS